MTTTPKQSEDIPVPTEGEPTTSDESIVDDAVSDPSVDEDDAVSSAVETIRAKRGLEWSRILVFGILPAVALLLAVSAGFLKWQESTTSVDDTHRIESVQAAKDSTVALLSYQPNTVEQQLDAARNLLTGEFRDAYTQLTNDVVIPGAKQQQISADASIPAAASVSVDENHAVVLVFVNQSTVIGTGAPSATTSAIRVTMDKVDGRWLISQFDPV